MTDTLLWILIILDLLAIVGAGFVIRELLRQIRALKGTVDAQKKTLDTFESLNSAVVNLVNALNPDRWAKEIEIHKKLADQKAEAFVEQERRRLEHEKEATKQSQAEMIKMLLDHYGGLIKVGLRLLPYVPKDFREKTIKEAHAPEQVTKIFLDVMGEVPDWSGGFRSILGENLTFADIAKEALDTRDPKTGGFDVRPPHG